MATERNDRVSADEARDLLARFAHARQTGNAADVWGPLDRMEALAHTVIAQAAEIKRLTLAAQEPNHLDTTEGDREFDHV